MLHSRETFEAGASAPGAHRLSNGMATTVAAALLVLVTLSPAAALERKGTIQVITTISYLSPMPADTTISVSASARLTNDAPTYHTQVTSASTSVKRSGSTATVTLSLHYTWAYEGDVAVQVGVSLRAATPAGESTDISVAIPLPANNKTTQVKIPAAL